MFNHATQDYKCPICFSIKGIENDDTWIKQEDIFYRDDLILGFIGSKFIEGNEGHPIIVPVQHFENIYEMPSAHGQRIFDVAQRVALAVKAVRKCDGITVVQNNEPAGDQHAFHYHMHVVPRFINDSFHSALWETRKSDPEERIDYARELREWFKK